ncbi:hypothetical protein BGX27_010268 [Mortierella sp. AM989]|nr:hypothetical protein BGX27_010268 [Mortierella sp. AM989]
MERLKRARHRSSAVSDESTCINDTANKNMSWQDSIENRDEALPTVSHNHVDNRQTNTSLRTHQQQLTQIHPFDNEPATVDVVGHIPCESSPSSRSMPIIPKVTEQLTQTAPSIHPLDAVESQGDTVLRSQEVTAGTKCTTSVLKSDQKVEPATNMMPAEDSNLGKEETTSRAQTLNRSKVGDAKDTGATPSSRPASAAQPSKPSSVLSQTLNPATIMLPITRDTLRELDMMEIFKNPQLRHDIVFDPHLQFRPNFDGERGHVKRREADRFWREVGVELNNRRAILAARRETTATMLDLAELSPSSPTSRLVQQQAQQMCPLPDAVLLPRLINELREILLSLLPQPPAAAQQDGVPAVNPERALLTSTLDPELLLQELDHGVLDVHALFRFLGDSLKGHCAPMRDALVESMVNIVVDFDEIVRGIRMCFEILEWMKLDIANHQLRTLRPWLLDNSIDFEQKHFSSLLARGGTINRTKEWFKRSWIKWDSVKRSVIGQSPNDGEQSGSEGKSLSSTLSSFNANRRSSIIRADIGENILDGVVNEGLLEMVMKPHSSVDSMPETFELDHYRMLSFHNDFQDLTILCTLLILFRQLAQNCWTQQDLVEIKKVVWLLLTDENANFGANTNPGPGATAAAAAGGSDKTGSAAQSHIGSSSGMKDIVVQIEFAARKVRERSKNTASASRRPSIALETPLPLSAQRVSHTPAEALGTNADSKEADASSIAASLSPLTTPSSTSSAPANGLSNSDTNLLTAWLDNALCKTSTLYMLIQKRLLIHFRRWLYVHSCSSMLVLSASCASLASAMSMSSASSNAGRAKATDDDDDDDKISSTSAVVNDGDSKKDQCLENSNENGDGTGNTDSSKPTNGISQGGQASGNGAVSAAAKSAPAPGVAPKLSPEEATKAAVEALAAKLSFNAAEMEAHGLTGLEDEMGALLEKIRAVSEFNKKVYGSWYRDMVKQGRAENWLEKSTSE